MKVWRLLPFIVLAVGFGTLCGCGGGTAGTSLATRSPFEGVWDGTTTDPITGQTGTMTLTIAADGTVTGSETIGTDPDPIPIDGSIDQGGSMNCQGHTPGQPPSVVGGTFSIDSQGMLVSQDASGAGRPAHRRHIRLHRRGGWTPPPANGS